MFTTPQVPYKVCFVLQSNTCYRLLVKINTNTSLMLLLKNMIPVWTPYLIRVSLLSASITLQTIITRIMIILVAVTEISLKDSAQYTFFHLQVKRLLKISFEKNKQMSYPIQYAQRRRSSRVVGEQRTLVSTLLRCYAAT